MTNEELEKKIEVKSTEIAKGLLDATLKEMEVEAEKKAAEILKAKEAEEAATKAAVVLKPDTDELLNAAQKDANAKEWKDAGEFYKGIIDFRTKGVFDNRLVWVEKDGQRSDPKHYDVSSEAQVIKTMTEGVDASGGFLVPEQTLMDIQAYAIEDAVVRPNNPFLIKMERDILNIPRVNDTTHASSLFGGVIAYWTEEAGAKTESEPVWGNCKLQAHELAGYTRASNSLIADSAVALGQVITRMFGEAWVWFEDNAFLNGNGVGQPLGILNAGCLIGVTRQDTNNVTWGDFPRLYARATARARKNGVWVMNQDVIPDIATMVGENTTAAASAGSVVWVSSDGGAKDPLPKTILGRPIIYTEKMGSLGCVNDVGFFDFSQYIIGDRQKMVIDTSAHVGFTSNTTYWRFCLRVDGQPWPLSALTPANGSNSLSPFVALAETS